MKQYRKVSDTAHTPGKVNCLIRAAAKLESTHALSPLSNFQQIISNGLIQSDKSTLISLQSSHSTEVLIP